MLKGADTLSDNSSGEDQELDQKAKELEKKLQQLLLDNKQHKKEQNSMTRKQAYLQSQVKTLSFVTALAPALETEKGAPSARYEAMRRRRDARLAKSSSKSQQNTTSASPEEKKLPSTKPTL